MKAVFTGKQGKNSLAVAQYMFYTDTELYTILYVTDAYTDTWLKAAENMANSFKLYGA